MKVWIINHYAIPPRLGGLVRHYYFSKFLQEKGIMHKYTFLGKELEKHFTKDSVHTELNKPMFGIETTTKMTIGEFCDYMTKLIAEYSQMTKGAFQMSETPQNYLHRKGY